MVILDMVSHCFQPHDLSDAEQLRQIIEDATCQSSSDRYPQYEPCYPVSSLQTPPVSH